MMHHEFNKLAYEELPAHLYDMIEPIYMGYEWLSKAEFVCLYKCNKELLSVAIRHFQEKKQVPACQAIELAEKYIGQQIKDFLKH